MAATGRHGARRLLVQALYQRQLAGHDSAEIFRQFERGGDFARIDREYFRELLDQITHDSGVLDELIAGCADRPLAQLDPVERGILWLGVAELAWHPDVPPKVVIAEGVQLAKEFGAQDSHRYINAILDTVAGRLRKGPAGG